MTAIPRRAAWGRLVQRVVGERLAAVAKPQRRGAGQPVAATGTEVAVQRPGGLRAEGDYPASTTLAPAHGGRAGGQVDVLGAERDDLAGPGTGLDHQPHERLVPAVAQLAARAGGDQRLDLLDGQRLDDLRVQPGRLEAEQGVGVALALLAQPGEKRRRASCRARAVAGSAPASSRSAVKALTLARSSTAGRPPPSARARKRRTPSP